MPKFNVGGLPKRFWSVVERRGVRYCSPLENAEGLGRLQPT